MTARCLDFSVRKSVKADVTATLLSERWHLLCERFLPVKFEGSVWRSNRRAKPEEPTEGWKLHVSATILEACEVFETVAPFLISEDVHFKAPCSLDELSNINCGLQYGYQQVGKFITIYPPNEVRATEIARHLHRLTETYFPIIVPFDEQYLPDSSVFYRYGAFLKIEASDGNGCMYLVRKNSKGEFVPDDRRTAIPDGVSNPFTNSGKTSAKSFANTPLGTTYKIFRALTQRGKGGTYEAFDLSERTVRLSIIKEGRRNGELGWTGQDGYALVQNEYRVLNILRKRYEGVPQPFTDFEIFGNYYFAMEYVNGVSLNESMMQRKRRFSIKKVLMISTQIAKIIQEIHQAGWVWNDCKPANLIVTKNNELRPIDFEGAYPINQQEPFDWKTKGFSRLTTKSIKHRGPLADLYSLGAVIYFLLTGVMFDPNKPVKVEKLRRDVPQKLRDITEGLLGETHLDLWKIIHEFDKLSNVT